MDAMNTKTLLDCGHEPSPHSGISTGYGTDAQGKTACYTCCADKDREQMRKTGRIILYLTSKKESLKVGKATHWEVTNWPGSLRLPVYYVREGRHNIARIQRTAYFLFEGEAWSARNYGDFSEIAHCRKLKTE